MFIAYLIASVVVIVLLLIGCWLVGEAFESRSYLVVSIFYWSVLAAGVGLVVQSEEEKGPCVQYETQLHFNAATKTMMPARVCILRGEWIEEG